MRRANPEQRLHRQVADYCRIVLPHSVLWSTFPSGGGGRIRGGILQSLGLLPGVADLLYLWTIQSTEFDLPPQIKVAWLELKSDKGRLSDVQVEFADRVKALGHFWAMARSLDDVRRAFAEWKIPTREAKEARPVILPGRVIEAKELPRAQASLFRAKTSVKP